MILLEGGIWGLVPPIKVQFLHHSLLHFDCINAYGEGRVYRGLDNIYNKEHICTRHMHPARTPRPPHPYLGLSPKKTQFLGPSLKLKTKFFNSEK